MSELAPTDPRPELDADEEPTEGEPTPYDLLMYAETLYLERTGWTYDNETRSWRNHDANRHFLNHGHAVNAQKQYDRTKKIQP